jgi:hypothetical protein
MNEANSIDLEYAAIEADILRSNKMHANAANLPYGFFIAMSAQGRKLGFGFYCPTCKIHIPGHAPNQVQHCGKVSKLPQGLCYNKTARTKHLTLGQRIAVQRFWWNVKTVVLKFT